LPVATHTLRRSNSEVNGNQFQQKAALDYFLIGVRLRISIPIGNEKLLVQGIVKTCHQSFGNGIQFLKLAPADRVKLEAFLEGESFFENE